MNTRVITFHNPLSRQGKSTLLWLTANALALANHRVAAMDCDPENRKTGEPSLSKFLNPKIRQLFDVYARPDMEIPAGSTVMQWHDKYLKSLDYLLYDGSQKPDNELTAILNDCCHGAVIPIRDDRGYQSGIAAAKALNKRNVAIHFVVNGFSGKELAELPGICKAYDAIRITLPELYGVTALTQSGKSPQMVDDSDAIIEAADKLASSIVTWLDNLESENGEKTNIHAIA